MSIQYATYVILEAKQASASPLRALRGRDAQGEYLEILSGEEPIAWFPQGLEADKWFNMVFPHEDAAYQVEAVLRDSPGISQMPRLLLYGYSKPGPETQEYGTVRDFEIPVLEHPGPRPRPRTGKSPEQEARNGTPQ